MLSAANMGWVWRMFFTRETATFIPSFFTMPVSPMPKIRCSAWPETSCGAAWKSAGAERRTWHRLGEAGIHGVVLLGTGTGRDAAFEDGLQPQNLANPSKIFPMRRGCGEMPKNLLDAATRSAKS